MRRRFIFDLETWAGLTEKAAGKVHYRVEHKGSYIMVQAWAVSDEQQKTYFGTGRKPPSGFPDDVVRVGEVMLIKRRDRSLPKPCRRNVMLLRRDTFGLQTHDEKSAPVWVLGTSDLTSNMRRQGIGREMYERAFSALVGKAIVVPDVCGAGSTSKMAARVWNSLKRDYPSKGLNMDELALAVWAK